MVMFVSAASHGVHAFTVLMPVFVLFYISVTYLALLGQGIWMWRILKNTRQLLLTISILTLLKAQECSHARSAVMLRHLSLYSNLIINPRLIAPSDSVCLTNSEKTQAISVSHLLSTTYFNLSLSWHAMPTLCWAASLTPVPLWFTLAGGRRPEYVCYLTVF